MSDAVDAARGAELRERDARELERRVREDDDARAVRLERAQRRAHLGRRPQVDGRAVLGEAFEQRSPVAGAARVELGRGGDAVLRAAPRRRARARRPRASRARAGACRRARPGRSRPSSSRRFCAPGRHADRDADRVDQDVERRARPAARRSAGAARRSPRSAIPSASAGSSSRTARSEQRAEERVLGAVRELAQHEVPACRGRCRDRDRGEREDDARPEQDRAPRGGGRRHLSDDRLGPQTGAR